MYTIEFADGSRQPATAISYEDAIIVATDGLGEDAVCEHDGDRTLVWESEADADGDDGAKAYAVIRERR